MQANFCVSRIEQWPISKLLPYIRNARVHSDAQIARIAASIVEFGFVNAVLIGPDGRIIAGHARVSAARKLGLTEIPVIVLDHLSAAQRRALVIADNRLALGASWDEEMLAGELAALQAEEVDLDILGFEDNEIKELLAAAESAEALTDEDAAPMIPSIPVSAPGDLWLLAEHRVLVGDATVAADVDRLMDNKLADLVFSDPPYNSSYEGYTKDRLTIQGDRMSAEQFAEFLLTSFQSYRRIVKPCASLYVCHSSSWQREFQNAIEQAGFQVRCQLIWAKNTFAWGFGRYKFQHEPLFYCHVKDQKDTWYGNRSQSTLWEETKPAANRLHPTMKPVELIERALRNSSRAGDIVVDLFGGSGSTLIACQRKGRKAHLMEIDPRYADAIVHRWQDHSGKQAILETDGRSYPDIARERKRVQGSTSAS
jgi:DNA modification methylase